MLGVHPLRGKCLEKSQELVAANPELTLVRGWYFEPMWNREEMHWWTKDANGVINDPTRVQFPSNGCLDYYREFNGSYDCEECGTSVLEENAVPMGRYITCSTRCARRLVGV